MYFAAQCKGMANPGHFSLPNLDNHIIVYVPEAVSKIVRSYFLTANVLCCSVIMQDIECIMRKQFNHERLPQERVLEPAACLLRLCMLR